MKNNTLYDNVFDIYNIPRRSPEELLKGKNEGKPKFDSGEKLSKDDILNIIYDYTYIFRSEAKVAKKWGLHPEHTRQIIQTFLHDLAGLSESYKLIEMFPYLEHPQLSLTITGKPIQLKMQIVHINEEFLAKLSKEEDEALTEAEQVYAWVFVHTGDNEDAIIKAGLDVGIGQPKEEKVEQEGKKKKITHTDLKKLRNNAFKLRGYYLRSKKNIKQYIQELREKRLADTNVDKDYIQSQLITLIEQLKEEGGRSSSGNLLRAIEMLGKTIPGTFSETINVAEVRPDEALDKLLELTKANIGSPKQLDNSNRNKQIAVNKAIEHKQEETIDV